MKLKNCDFLEQIVKKMGTGNDKNFIIDDKLLLLTKSIKLDDLHYSFMGNDIEKFGKKSIDVLKLLPDRSCFLYVNTNTKTVFNNITFQFIKKDNIVTLIRYQGLVGESSYGLHLVQNVFTYNLSTNEFYTGVFFNKEQGLRDDVRETLDKFYLKIFGHNFESIVFGEMIEYIIKPMIFIELSEDKVKLIDVKSKTEYGNIMKPIHVKNQTNINVIYVNSNWNVETIVLGEFKVRGHFRLQRCGVRYSEVKLIYIDEFVKTHYIRRSTRDIVFDEVPTKQMELV